MQKIIRFVKKYWITFCIYLAMVLAYKYIADNKLFGGYLFPPVKEVANSFVENRGTLFLNMIYSFQLLIPAIAIAFSVAILVGTILGMHKKIREVVYPVIYSISVIPSILMSPFALLIAPDFRSASLFLVVYNTIWATLFATINGIMTIDKVYLDKAKTLELNPIEKMFRVILPAAMPSMKESCAAKKTISCGMMEMRDRARMRFQLKPLSASMDSLTKMDMGYLRGVET